MAGSGIAITCAPPNTNNAFGQRLRKTLVKSQAEAKIGVEAVMPITAGFWLAICRKRVLRLCLSVKSMICTQKPEVSSAAAR